MFWVYDRLQKMQEFFVEKYLKISQKLHGGDRKQIKICRKKQKQNKKKKKKTHQHQQNLKIDKWGIFTPMPTSVAHISK